ncbi:MAG: alpha/beta hydrolase family protein [Calditrichia bacterium]
MFSPSCQFRTVSMTNRFCIALFVLLLGSPLIAASEAGDEIVGDWTGKLEMPNSRSELRLILHIQRNDKGQLFSTMDSPDQGAAGIPASSITYGNKDLEIRFASIGGLYRAKFQENGRLDGIWSQGGARLDMSMIRLEEQQPSGRPQDPKAPFPYVSKDISFENKTSQITLAGTLSIPNGSGPFPAVIIISGSGQQNRDGELLNHRPYLILSDYLTRNGIAVLRYDDRGFAKSTGAFNSADSRDFATDALAGRDWLKKQVNIDTTAIGFIGHSEGGYIAAMLAAENPNVPFIISLAGSGIRGDEIIKQQTALILKAHGGSAKLIAWNRDLQENLFQIVKDEPDNTIAKQKIRSHFNSFFASLNDEEKKEFSQNGDIDANIALNASQLTSPWFRFFLQHDPATDWQRVRCPVLAIIGSKDLQVPPQVNLNAIRAALQKAGNKRTTVKELEGLNHLFQNAISGAPSEYGAISETFSPSAMKLVRDWILQTVKE